MSKSLSIETDNKTEEDQKSEQERKTDKNIRCRQCEHEITKPALAIQPHEHTFRNPAGYSFHVLCYSDAPGAAQSGEPTALATWFPGYSWSFALCRQCHNHLGWWYSGRDRFAGLIATRLLR